MAILTAAAELLGTNASDLLAQQRLTNCVQCRFLCRETACGLFALPTAAFAVGIAMLAVCKTLAIIYFPETPEMGTNDMNGRPTGCERSRTSGSA